MAKPGYLEGSEGQTGLAQARTALMQSNALCVSKTGLQPTSHPNNYVHSTGATELDGLCVISAAGQLTVSKPVDAPAPNHQLTGIHVPPQQFRPFLAGEGTDAKPLSNCS